MVTFTQLSRDLELTAEPLRVLIFMLDLLDVECDREISQIEVAATLGMHASNVNRAIALLVKKEVLIAGPKIGKSCSYRLNHTLFARHHYERPGQ